MKGMTTFLWRALALLIVATPGLVTYLIWKAKKRPYFHLPGYMNRWWLVPRAYLKDSLPNNEQPGLRDTGCGPVSFWRDPIIWAFQKAGISIRIHHILREDNDRHLHDHPWSFRSVVLKGFYIQEFLAPGVPVKLETHFQGDTYEFPFGAFHRIRVVPKDGVWTLFFMFKEQDEWGFLKDGEKVPAKVYLHKEKRDEATAERGGTGPGA